MTTATATPNLQEQLDVAERELEAAKRDAGIAHLDGGNGVSARKRLSDARALVESLREAQAEDVRRAEAAAEVEAQRRDARRRWVYLAWCSEYVERLEPMLKLRAELEAAEQHVMALCDLTLTTIGADVTETRSLRQWADAQVEAGLLPSIDFPHELSIEVKLQRGFAAGGEYSKRAVDGQLSAAEVADWTKRLPPLVKNAAKPLGNDAKPENLPW